MVRPDDEHELQRQRDDLTGEHAAGDAGQLVLAFLFMAIWALDTFLLDYTTFLNQYVPLAVRIALGLALLAVSGYLARTSIAIVFGEQREKPCVIRKSVFGVVRHPMYLSEIVLYLGLLVMSISLAAALVWGVAILFLRHISRHEERLLLARFGGEYERYMREVPMLLPRSWKR
jgi:protein-S-isoprenylcysteine O-methyltransferase Ste14